MKLFKTQAIIALLLFAAVGTTIAQSDNHTVTIDVQAIDELSIEGGNITLAFTDANATAGSQPSNVTDATTSYSITTNSAASQKITAALDVNPAANTTLALEAAAPSSGTSAGQKSLTTTAADVVTSIEQDVASGLTLTYEASATVDALVASTPMVVTLTLVAE